MAIKITVSDKVGFRVKGVFNDADGAEQEFEFSLTARRMSEDDINKIQHGLITESAKTGNHTAVVKCLADRIITNWGQDVRDDTDAPMPYTTEAFTALCQAYKNLGLQVWQAYLTNVGAKAKN